jgi:hypothetical protein
MSSTNPTITNNHTITTTNPTNTNTKYYLNIFIFFYLKLRYYILYIL